MSESRSPTPKPNINPSLSTPPSASTSRHDSIPEQSTSRLPPSPRPRTRSREISPVHSPPMAKRLRRGLPRPRTHSSPSADDSQGDLADTEDGTQSQRSERSPAPSSTPKKKRTRTLTTPHQSAVLHALLAQSRFPTTAMREEVGRSIGLSARKVQIWFQNQRQKARRPQSDTPLDRPPQYGAFPHPSEHGSPFALGRPYSRESQAPIADYSYFAPPTEPRLLGPGMPGQVPMSSFPPPHILGSSGSSLPERRSASPPRLLWSRTTSSRALIERDPSRTLPPLVFPPNRGHSIPPRSAPASMPPFRFPSPSRRSESTTLSPPFTLQPQPQWDNSHFTSSSLTSAASSPWAGSTSGLLPETIHEEPATQPEPEPDILPSRSGRYDPVRATFIPFSTPSPPVPPSAD
ncbi:hypothetical protein C8J56DRAFT_144842 [Mycena floridula]|nr:hypothetical protein C8J56DRAFT_144842 [Mycena floridula]